MPLDANHNDAAYLWAIRKALGELELISRGKSESDLLNDLLYQRAVERCIHIVGEMASKVSAPTRDAHSGVDWQGIISQRNVIAHSYDTIMYDKLWVIVSVHAPDLSRRLDSILPEPPDDPLPE